MHRPLPWVVGLIAALGTLGVIGSSPTGPSAEGASARRATGELRIRERKVETGSVYIEGAYQYVSVRRTRDNRLVYRARSANALRARLRLRPGYYRVASWTRSCSGSCDRLDPPSDSCRGLFRVRPGRFVTATIRSGVGVPCRVVNP
jgi:hypothetical protein